MIAGIIATVTNTPTVTTKSLPSVTAIALKENTEHRIHKVLKLACC